MIEFIRWLKIYEDLDCAEIGTVRPLLKKPEWREYPVTDEIRQHALNLFANNIEVIAKEDGTYICNRGNRRKMYRKAGNRAVMFESLVPADQPLAIVGFQGGT